MSFLAIFLVMFFVLVVLSPWLGADDRPGFRRPERRIRPDVGTWFRPSR